MRATSPLGFAPDWVVYQANQGWRTDKQTAAIGSYDAIRLYLWVGMLDDGDADKPALLQALSGMHTYLRHYTAPMEKVNVSSGVATGRGPPGFSAALLPYLQSLSAPRLLSVQMTSLAAQKKGALLGEPPAYYDQVLGLFGTGFLAQRFRFDREGQLIPAWKKVTPAPR